MKVVFFGTPEFAVGTLAALLNAKIDVVAVVTAPDKPAGRGQNMQPSAVKKFALENNLPILQPEKLKNQDFIHTLTSYQADLFIVVAFRMLPEMIWQMPKNGTFNVHASLLPQYRGAAPINWALINGENETGVTTFFLKHEIDTGNIIAQKAVNILPEDNFSSLYQKLMKEGAELAVATCELIKNNQVNATPQPLAISGNVPLKHAPKIFKDLGIVNWEKDALHHHNLIRGLFPQPGVSIILKNDAQQKSIAIKLLASYLADPLQQLPTRNFSVIEKQPALIFDDLPLVIKELQPAGKPKMSGKDFLNGIKLDEAWYWASA
ncbi:MAG: hypothetical protein RIQ89_823 [Bacteroidota bacterium]